MNDLGQLDRSVPSYNIPDDGENINVNMRPYQSIGHVDMNKSC